MGVKGKVANRPVTLRDVARHCGLSVFPVSRALNGKPGVTPETMARVQAAAAALGYDPGQNLAARRLASRKTGERPRNHVLGLLIPSHLGKVRFFFELFRGIEEAASERGYSLLMVANYDPVARRELELKLPSAVWRGEVDGLLVHQVLPPGLLAELRAHPAFGARPILCMMGGEAPGCLTVRRDERGGARLALAHLLALGHRRVLYLRRPSGGYPMDERESGYRDACAAAGLAPQSCLRPVFVDNDSEVEAPLHAALAAEPAATALMAINDPNALHACYALQRLGRRVPEDLSVLGWDDTDPLPDGRGENLLSTVRFDIAGLGRMAAESLMTAIAAPAEPPAALVLPAQLRPRRTTAAP